ncbi:hypothetical protein JCM8097_001694 [Rhodosporidiobolus ruineniae]
MADPSEPSPPPLAPGTALSGLIDAVEAVIRQQGEDDDKGVGKALEVLAGSMRVLRDEPPATFPAKLAELGSHLSTPDLLSFPLPSRSSVSAASPSSAAPSQLKTLWATLAALARWMTEGVMGAAGGIREDGPSGEEGREEGEEGMTERKGWEKGLVGVLLGIKHHLDTNDFDCGASRDDLLAYRSLLATHLFPVLLHVVLPNPSGFPSSSANEIDDGGPGMGVPPEAKYVALEVVGELLSKSEENKARLRGMLEPESIGRLLVFSLDFHISFSTLEIAFRLTPVKARSSSSKSKCTAAGAEANKPSERDAYIARLFKPEWCGKSAAKLRTAYDAVKVTNWEETTEGLLKLIAEGHLRRPQPFIALSLKYNNVSFLPLTNEYIESRNSTTSNGGPSLKDIKGGAYEKNAVWVSKHIIGATGVGGADNDEEEDWGGGMMVVDLGGVERVFVEDLGTDLDLLRITFLLSPASPLHLSHRPHPSAPAHVGRALLSADESQASSRVPRTHKLEIVVSAEGYNASVLEKVLRERAKHYPNLGHELYAFPQRSSTADATGPAANGSTGNGRNGAAPPPESAAEAPTLARSAGEGGGGHGKTVAFAPTPATLQRGRDGSEQNEEKEKKPKRKGVVVEPAPRKSSQGIEPVEQVFPADAFAALSPATADEEGEGESQERLRERREEVKELAGLDRSSEAGGRSRSRSSDSGRVEVDDGAEGMMDLPDREDFGGGFGDAGIEYEEDGDLVPPGQLGDGGTSSSRQPVYPPTSDPAEVARKAKPAGTPAAALAPAPPANVDKGKQRAVPTTSTSATKSAPTTRPRAGTVGKPRSAEEEDVTPSQRAGLRREESVARLEKEVKEKERERERGKVPPRRGATAVSSELSDLSGSDAEEEEQKKPTATASKPTSKANSANASNSKARKPPPPPAADAASPPPAAESAPGSKRRRSPRLSSGSEDEPAAAVEPIKVKTKSRVPKKTVVAPATKKAKTAAEASSDDRDDRGESATAGRPKRAAVAKKVVSGLKGKKRQRDVEDEDEQEEADELDETEDGDEEESDDYVAPPTKSKGKAGGKKSAAASSSKKVVKPSAAASKRDSKRRKLSPPPDDDDQPETDYDTYPGEYSLEPKKQARRDKKQYGAEKKPAKRVGGARKAGKPRSRAGKGDEEGTETSTTTTTKGRKGGARKGRKSEESAPTTTGAGRTTRSRAAAKGKKVVKAADEESIEDIENVRLESQDPDDMRISKDIPAPIPVNLTSKPALGRHSSPAKSAAAATAADNDEAVSPKKQFQSLSQLIRSNLDDDSPDKQYLGRHTVEAAAGMADDDPFLAPGPAEGATAEEEEYGGGFEQNDLGDFNAAFDLPPLAVEKPQDQHLNPAERDEDDFSLSHYLDPAKDDQFVEHAVPSVAKDEAVVQPQLRQQQHRNQSKALPVEQQQETQPKVLVEDTQSQDEPKQQQPVKLGAHSVAPQARNTSREDVEMVDASTAVGESLLCAQRDKGKGKAEEVDTDDLYSDGEKETKRSKGVDDSGVHFDVPMDEGVEGDEEEAASPGADLVADGSSDRVSDPAAKPVSAPLPESGSSARRLLVEKPPRRPRSAGGRPPPAPQPVASTSKGALVAGPSAVATHAVRPSRLLKQGESAYASSDGQGVFAFVPPVSPAQKPVAAPSAQKLPGTAAKVTFPLLRSSRSRPSVAAFSASTASKQPSTSVLKSFALAPLPPLKKQQQQPWFKPIAAAKPFKPAVLLGSGSASGSKPRHGQKQQQVSFAPASGKSPKMSTPATKGNARAPAPAPMSTPRGQQHYVENDEEDDGTAEWDEDDHELFDLFADLGRIVVEKHRSRRASLRAQYEHSVLQFDRVLGKHLVGVQSESAQIATAARAALLPSPPLAASTQLVKSLDRTADANRKLWAEAQGELEALRSEGPREG